jgi:hypothetical protein
MASVPFMRPPVYENIFQVGDIVEAFCDHDKGDQRKKGWLRGTIVQIDGKLTAVQFKDNVFLTGGWMVPDHILWYPLNSPHVRMKTS